MRQDFTIWRNQILQNPRDISPLKFGMSQDEVIEIFGKPDAVSTMRSDGKPLILKYCDIELHFDRKAPHGLYLVYSDDEIELSITDHHDELLWPITNTEPVDNEFFLRDGAVYFSGLYENGLLKGVAPKDFCCWHYWGKSSTACFLGGIRLRGADPASFRVLNYAYAMDKTAVYTTSGRIPDVELTTFQVLDNGQNDLGAPQGYAKDSRQVYFHNGDGRVKIIKGAEVSSFRSLGDTYFARDEKRIYAYGKQLPKADLPSWELLSAPIPELTDRKKRRKLESKGAHAMEQKKTKKRTAPPRYDDAFKAGAVRLVTEQGRQPVEVAKELGICIDTLRSWLKASGIQMGQVSRQNREQKRIRELEAENRSLRRQLGEKDEVIDVLKKSVGILSKP